MALRCSRVSVVYCTCVSRYLIRHKLPPRISESEMLLQLAWTYELQARADDSAMHATLSLKAYQV